MSNEHTVNASAAQAERVTAQMRAILARSATDPAFRQKLLTDPRAAVAEFSARPVSDIPASFNLVFVENKADATIVLPDPINTSGDLSDQELETVAGGMIAPPKLTISPPILVLTVIDPIIDPVFYK
jgi:hypothetical protein